MKDSLIFLGLFLLATVHIFLLLVGICLIAQNHQQLTYLNNSADCMLAYGKEGRLTSFIENLNANDVWGRPCKLKYEVTKEYRKATVISMGRDGIPDTKDDWIVEKYDYNKSYQFGKYAGDRAKQIVDGLVDGIKEEDKFKEQKNVK